MTGTPNDMTPGWVCRVRLAGGGITYTSPRHMKDAAVAVADAFRRTLTDRLATGDPDPFVEFPTENGLVIVRADKVTAIEPVPVTPLRYNGSTVGVETRPVMEGLTRR